MLKQFGLLLKYAPLFLDLLDVFRALGLLIDSMRKGENPNVAPIARKAFALIPAKYKAPEGSATQQEFVDFVYNGLALFTK